MANPKNISKKKSKFRKSDWRNEEKEMSKRRKERRIKGERQEALFALDPDAPIGKEFDIFIPKSKHNKWNN